MHLQALLFSILLVSVLPAQEAGTVSGKFVGNGKAAALKFVRAEPHERFNDKEAMTLIFTEKDPASVKKPSFDALFGKLGSALVLNVFHDGGIFGCQVVHLAHQKQGFSSIGQIKTADFKIADGRVSGQALTGGVLDTFGEKWEVDLKFSAPLPKSAAPAESAPAVAREKPAKSAPAAAVPEVPAGPAPGARKLPLPADAQNVEFKAIVKQIQFTSPRPVAAVAEELSAKLKEAGWKDGPGGVKGPRNTILSRTLGNAKLTITIAPDGSGSLTRIFGEGLEW